MRKHFIKKLTETAISTTDLALNVESMSEQIQSMIEKITNIKTNCVIGYMSIDFANNEHIDIEQVKHCLKDKKLKIEALLNL